MNNVRSNHGHAGVLNQGYYDLKMQCANCTSSSCKYLITNIFYSVRHYYLSFHIPLQINYVRLRFTDCRVNKWRTRLFFGSHMAQAHHMHVRLVFIFIRFPLVTIPWKIQYQISIIPKIIKCYSTSYFVSFRTEKNTRKLCNGNTIKGGKMERQIQRRARPPRPKKKQRKDGMTCQSYLLVKEFCNIRPVLGLVGVVMLPFYLTSRHFLRLQSLLTV